jgi:hypothetical protein
VRSEEHLEALPVGVVVRNFAVILTTLAVILSAACRFACESACGVEGPL